MTESRSRSVPRWFPWGALGVVLAVQLAIWWREGSVEPVTVSGARPPAVEVAADAARFDALVDRMARLEEVLAERPPGPDAHREPALREQARAGEEGLLARVAILEERLETLEGSAEEERRARERDRAGVRSLNGAIARGDMLEVQRLIDSGLDLDARDDERETPLASAAQAGNLEAIDLLVAHGADLERTSGRRSMTPLLAALDAGQGEAALALMGRGSSIEAVDKNGEGALIWASFNGSAEVVRELVARDSQLDFQAHDGNTALMDAARRGHLAIVRMLLEGGADPNVENGSGETALALALEEGQQAIASLLVEYGAR